MKLNNINYEYLSLLIYDLIFLTLFAQLGGVVWPLLAILFYTITLYTWYCCYTIPINMAKISEMVEDSVVIPKVLMNIFYKFFNSLALYSRPTKLRLLISRVLLRMLCDVETFYFPFCLSNIIICKLRCQPLFSNYIST